MMDGIESVSVIIPTYYRHKYLRDVLEKLCAQTVAPHEVIVPDQTPIAERPAGFYKGFAARLPLQVIDIDQPSITAPRNRAARAATGDILLFIDDDVVFRDDFVESHVQVLTGEKVDVVNGAVTLKEELPQDYPWDIGAMDPVRFFLAAPNHKWNGMMLGVSSCNFSIRRSVFLAVNGFDENCPRMVDFELGYRLFRYGAKTYFSDKPFARHLRAPGGGSRQNPRNHNKLVAALYIHKKHFPGWMTTQFMLKMLLDMLFEKWTFRIPFQLVIRAWRLILANRRVNERLKKIRNLEQEKNRNVNGKVMIMLGGR